MQVCVLNVLSYCIVAGVGAHKDWSESKIHDVTEEGSEGAWNVIMRARRLGLHASSHTVRTEDGYVLRVFRLRGAGASAGRNPPVLLMHGLLQSAGAWLDAGGAALATLLAGAGRDLWLGNTRGSQYSRRHAWLHPDTDALYWRFSVDEIGRYDLPALLDHVLAATGSTKLDYVGFSQGATTFFIMCSELPHYCDKVNLMVALAPAARVRGLKTLARIALEYFEKVEDELSQSGIWEILPNGGLIQSFSEALCNLPKIGLSICIFLRSLYDGSQLGSLAGSTYLATAAGFPAGTSVHNLAWYGQNIRSKYFQKFDYGPEQNLILYGNETAPAYNLSAVTVPTVIMYGKNDQLVDASNVKWLIKKLPNVAEVFEVEDSTWSHLDFIQSRNIPKYVYSKIKKYLGNNS